MSTTQQMLDAHPADLGSIDQARLAACIDACAACAQTCTSCADACLSDKMVDQLRSCISADLDCADICATTARVLSRHTGYDASLTRALLIACAAACRAGHIRHYTYADVYDHRRICADACRAGERACRELLDSLD